MTRSRRIAVRLSFVLTTLWCFGGLGINAQAQSEQFIKYVNGSRQSMTVFFQPEGMRAFLNPPLVVRAKDSESARFTHEYPGRRYLVIQDEAKRAARVGWVDLESVARSSTPVILLDALYVQEQVAYTYTVYELVTEERTDASGRRYTVTKRVPVQKTGTRVVTVLKPSLKVAVDGKWENLSIQPE